MAWSRIMQYSTYVMIVLATLGATLPSVHIAGIYITPYRLLLIPYLLLAIFWTMKQHQIQLVRGTSLLVIFLLIAISSVTWSIYPNLTLRDAAQLGTGAVLAVALSFILIDRKSIHRSLIVLSLLGVAALVISIPEVLTGNNLPTSKYAGRTIDGNIGYLATAWHFNINDLSMFLLLTIAYPMATIFSKNISSQTKRNSLIFTVAIIGLVFNNGSRAALISVAIMIAVVAILSYVSHRDAVPDWISFRPIMALFSLLTYALGVVLLALPNPIPAKSSSIFARWELYEAEFSIGTSSIIGVGLGSSSRLIQERKLTPNEVGDPHSWFGVAFTELGIAGLLVLLALFAYLISNSIRASLRTKDPAVIAIAAWAFALPLSTLGPSNALYLESTWVGIGIIISAIKLSFAHTHPSA
ncbi:O-antigen ligase family protein [Halobacterium sp. MBLA0001]|uniref:O-antigen ligase family protein n=1 Tax=Halobacterium sp. MBLA0001 TaxID=3413511 RepID=UPI003C796088